MEKEKRSDIVCAIVSEIKAQKTTVDIEIIKSFVRVALTAANEWKTDYYNELLTDVLYILYRCK